ncbi:MAG TPA: 16S rRNA (guanine(527)-N(7))-methyltransferase RsmG [Marmoricola sp.]|nr:16S rRNA (guanine(527)-N(7))-methyltransferase RsmG [Marmoricola sp.]
MAYAELLADAGTVRGLIGPREVPRLWERHLLNCAVVAELIPAASPGSSPDDRSTTLCDIGSGAGLPGIALALCRPDLTVTLLEPLLRRVRFLEEAVTLLGLGNVEVRRGRAEELGGRASFDVVTSRAVAPLDRLARWSLPLTRAGGLVLAMKGSSAAAEVAAAAAEVRRLGGRDVAVVTAGGRLLEQPVTVVRMVKDEGSGTGGAGGVGSGASGRPD